MEEASGLSRGQYIAIAPGMAAGMTVNGGAALLAFSASRYTRGVKISAPCEQSVSELRE
jgi:hypothetical protein